MADNQSLGAPYYIKHITVISVFTGLASGAVILRYWARRIQKMSLELNDYLIVLALLFALGESAINIYGCCYGLARAQSQEEIMKAIIFSQKSQFMSIIIWGASVTFVRASIIVLYIRLFPTRLFRMFCYLVILINVCFFVGIALADCLICQPASYRWDQFTGGKGSCGDEKSLDLFISIFNLFLDVAAVVLPMPVLWGLNTAVGKKVMLSCMFGMGTTICALTIWRIYDSSTISASNAQEAYAVIALLANLEALLGIICACLPVLKPIFNKMRGTAPKGGKASRVNEILKSGTIPIFMRVSQMLTLASRKGKYSSSDEETLTETSGWYGERKNGRSGADGGRDTSVTTKEIGPPMPQKAERVMGINAPEIHVRRDVEVQSVASRDERGLAYEEWEGRQERW